MPETVTNYVQSLRIKAEATQEQLARAIGVSRQTVIAMEKGNYTPSVKLAIRLADYFKCSIEDIFCIETIRQKATKKTSGN